MSDRLAAPLTVVATSVALLLAMDLQRLFAAEPLASVLITLENEFYFALLGLFLPLVFLNNRRHRLIDPICAAAAAGCCSFLLMNVRSAVDNGWEFGAPALPTAACFLLWALVLEGVRRAGGWGLFTIALVFSLLPIVADRIPPPLAGMAADPQQTAAYHILSIESVFGLPFRAFAELVLGFVVFGVALQHTGGGKFFLDLAFAMLGRTRGGAAKVSVLSSGLMGSMSGSVITNVLTTGQITIPAMRSTGVKPHIAGGIEACASTGGVLLPPIMGSTAFVMATFLDVPYAEVALAATVPSLLYFGGLFLQIDAYAVKHDLEGVADGELPAPGATLRQGWPFVTAFVGLIVMLLVLQRESIAPFIATALLLAINQILPQKRMNAADAYGFLFECGRLLADLAVILAAVGLIVGAFSITGLSGTLVNDLLFLAGDSVSLLLVMGAFTSFVLGIGMTVTAAYIFLAIILAPALVQGGLAPMAVHLFILYWAMLSFITPPVALGAFAAASIARSNPLQTGFAAMRLGGIIYLIPFLFVIDPALILQGSAFEIVSAILAAGAGLFLVISGLQGYVLGVGGRWHLPARSMLTGGGLLIVFPSGIIGLGAGIQTLIGVGVAAVPIAIRLLRR